MGVAIEEDPSPLDVRAVLGGLGDHALPIAGTLAFKPLAAFARDESGAVVGGIVGTVNWTWLQLNYFWVDEQRRGTGLGKRLLAAIEQAGVERGCVQAHLDTFSYQARPFYERQGYELFATLEDYPPGGQRFFMRKRLVPA